MSGTEEKMQQVFSLWRQVGDWNACCEYFCFTSASHKFVRCAAVLGEWEENV